MIGRSADDQFTVFDQSANRTIDGGNGFDLLILAQSPTAQVDLRSLSATGVASFSRLESIQGTGFESTIFGPNRDVQWTLDDYVTTAKWNGLPEIQFINFGSVIAGNRQDNFLMSTIVAPNFYLYPSIHAGGGSDTIETFQGSDESYNFSNFELQGLGSGYVMQVQFESVENLVGGAISDGFSFHDLSPSDQWFQTIKVRSGVVFSYVEYSGQQGVTVNFQTRSATGVGNFEGIEYFYGTTANDTVIGSNRDNTWNVQANFGIISSDLDIVIGFERLQAGQGNDYLYVSTLAADDNFMVKSLSGGGGTDSLSFSQAETAVNVSLATGQASVFANGISQFENVIGTAFDDVLEGNNSDNILIGLAGNDLIHGLNGNDVLVGGAGDDLLHGGAGRDLLIGGTGSDWLYGGNGEDLIISGLSNLFAWETNTELGVSFTALNAIMAEWTSNRSYSQRISRLRNGVGPGSSVALNSSTIQSDGEVDQVFGEGDNDWFWLGAEDLAADRLSVERLN